MLVAVTRVIIPRQSAWYSVKETKINMSVVGTLIILVHLSNVNLLVAFIATKWYANEGYQECQCQLFCPVVLCLQYVISYCHLFILLR